MIKAVKWYFALTKRLFKHPSFILILLFIPLCAFGVNVATQEDHGVLTIAIGCEDDGNETYFAFRDKLLNEESVINFYEVENYLDAINDVNDGKADSAWIFRDNLDDRMYNYVSSTENEPVCRAYFKEDNVFNKISREKLYGLLLCKLSYNYCYDFVSSRVDVDRQELSDTYRERRTEYRQDFVDFTYVNSVDSKVESVNYLTSPIRGLLSLAVVVCILASMMLSINDENEGRFSYFPVKRRLMLHYSSCLAAGVVGGAVALISIYFAEINVSLLREFLLMILLVIASSGFGCLLGTLFSTVRSFSYVIPVTAMLIGVLCPVFINTFKLPLIQNILPAYHYLTGVYSDFGILNLVKYIVVVFPLSVLVYCLKKTVLVRSK